jgi:hypothetical protein
MTPIEAKILDLEGNDEIQLVDKISITITPKTWFENLYIKIPDWQFRFLTHIAPHIDHELSLSIKSKISASANEKFPKIYLSQSEGVLICDHLLQTSTKHRSISAYQSDATKLLKTLLGVKIKSAKEEITILSQNRVNYYNITLSDLVSTAMKSKSSNPTLYTALWKLMDYVKLTQNIGETQVFDVAFG